MVEVERVALDVLPTGQVIERLNKPVDAREAALGSDAFQPQAQVVVPGLPGEGLRGVVANEEEQDTDFVLTIP